MLRLHRWYQADKAEDLGGDHYDLMNPYKALYTKYGGQENPGSYYGLLYSHVAYTKGQDVHCSDNCLPPKPENGWGSETPSTPYWYETPQVGHNKGFNVCQRCNYCVGKNCRDAYTQMKKLMTNGVA